MSELAPLPSPARRRGQALDSLERIERQIAMLEVQKRQLTAAVYREDRAGMYARYVRDELAILLRRSPRQCQNAIDTALVFADFPAVHALIGEGIWLIDHADAALDELVRSGLDDLAQRQVLELVPSRRVHLTPWQVRQAVRTAVMVLFPEHVAELAAKKEIDRTVAVYDDGAGASLLASGPTHLVQAMMASLDELCRTAAADDPRTLGQRRFDTLQALVCGQITPGNWQVHVLTSLTTLTGEDELPGEVIGRGPIPAEQARELAAQGVLRRVVVDDDGMLVAVDVRTHRPDLTPDPTPLPDPVPAPDAARSEQAPVRLQTLEPAEADHFPIEPEPTDESDPFDEPGPDGALKPYDEPQFANPLDLDDEPVAEAAEPTAGSATESMADPSGEGSASVEPSEEEVPDRDDLAWYALNQPLEPDEVRDTYLGGRPAYLRTWWSDTAYRTALHRLATDPLRPVDLSTDKYVTPKPLERHLQLRERTCIFPGCPRKASECDNDHLIPWPRGRTCPLNLAPECPPHHIAKHQYFTVERLPDGTYRWTSPAGITADRQPRPVLDAWTYRSGR